MYVHMYALESFLLNYEYLQIIKYRACLVSIEV